MNPEKLLRAPQDWSTWSFKQDPTSVEERLSARRQERPEAMSGLQVAEIGMRSNILSTEI